MRKLIPLLIMCFIFTQCTKVPQERPKSAEELRQELKLMEGASPLKYIACTNGTMKQNLVREAGFFNSAEYDGYVVSCNIINKASIARFKDAKIEVQYISRTNTIIKSDYFTLYKFLDPGRQNHFSATVHPPSAFKEFHIVIDGATFVSESTVGRSLDVDPD